MITETDQKMIDFITDYYKETGFYPDYLEIMDGMGWKSTSTVSPHMARLEKEGIIVRKEYGSAQYRLLNMDFRLRSEKNGEIDKA